jgi:glutaminyl-peptide cyclotransferase
MCKSHRLSRVYALGHLTLYLLCGLDVTPAQARHASPDTRPFRANDALADTTRAVSFGERPSGSDALAHLREWIAADLKATRGELSLDEFTGSTPAGPVRMVNLILKFPGTSGKAIAVTGHYDTKKIPMVRFVGANDGGSSAGFLIEFAHAISRIKHRDLLRDDIYIVFFDGEEAVGTWTDRDSLYGSRHLASKWAGDGTLSRLKALINIDMIGDKDLDILNDGNSSQALRNQVARIAAKLGDSKYFRSEVTGVDDDHRPFVDAGVNAIDIIDLDYGPNGNSPYWHTGEDTMDKLSAHSLQVVGDVVLELVKELGQ